MSFIATLMRNDGKKVRVEVVRRIDGKYYLVRDNTGRPDRLVSWHRLRDHLNRQLPGSP